MSSQKRNDLCPCGSGKKYKQCCLERDQAFNSNNHNGSASITNDFQAALEHYRVGRLHEAETICQNILQQDPNNPDALNLLGMMASRIGMHDVAVELISGAINAAPNFSQAHFNLGNALKELCKLNEAVICYRQAVSLKPDYADAHYNLGNVLNELGCREDAVESFGKSLRLRSGHAEAYYGRGLALLELKQYQAALEDFDKAMVLKPDCEFLYGVRLHTKMNICDWSDIANQRKQLEEKIEHGEMALKPSDVLAISAAPAMQRKAAKLYVQCKHPANHTLPAIHKRPRHNKIRIGYFFPDFSDSPITSLVAELFESHDKSRFEIIAFSFGQNRNDQMEVKGASVFDRFIDVRNDVRNQSDQDIAMLARNLWVDIAVDLGCFAQGDRADVFALRAAPVQVSYLGYPGTTDAEYMDYLIADSALIPEELQHYYSEKIVYLPSYLPSDTRRRASGRVFTREELGLPPSGFVFCCFTDTCKITPDIYDVWMRILKRVEGSVLWLAAVDEKTASNLKNETVRRGVDANRVVFAKHISFAADHLARLCVADLFLDTLPYNACKSASDALWMGLPVVTCTGQAFTGRVGASLLSAIHLPELITSTLEEYEALAVELATQEGRLKNIKDKLASNRLTAPLFDIKLYTRHIEAAYQAMYQRYQGNKSPAHMSVNGSSEVSVTTCLCPVCKKEVERFLPLPEFYKENLEKYGYAYSFDEAETLNYRAYSCPHCMASDRDRLYALYVSKYLKEQKVTKISMLEIAPSRPLSNFLKNTGKIALRTADLLMQDVDDCIDITDMACYKDGIFDSFVCSHVLEHVPDDLKAMSELYRIIKPGGWGILMVPIIMSLNRIDEDPLLEDAGERWRRFGQDDHIRMYSKNGFLERAEATGFTVRQYGQEYFGLNVFNMHGISEKSVLYVVDKPLPH